MLRSKLVNTLSLLFLLLGFSFVLDGCSHSPAKSDTDLNQRLTSSQADLIRVWSDDKRDDIVVQGEVNPHPDIKVIPGGVLDIRIVNINEISRPFIFRRFENVTFPFHYSVHVSDFVSQKSLPYLFLPFYLEAVYYHEPQDEKLMPQVWRSVGGEAWGDPGRPYPLQMGQTRDFLLNSYVTPEIYGAKFSKLVQSPGAQDQLVSSGWLYVAFPLRAQIEPNQEIKVNLLFCSGSGSDGTLVATLPVTIPDVNSAVEWHLTDPAIFQTAGYIKAQSSVVMKNGETLFLTGGRASGKVNISLKIDSLKVVLRHLSSRSPTHATPCYDEPEKPRRRYKPTHQTGDEP